MQQLSFRHRRLPYIVLLLFPLTIYYRINFKMANYSLYTLFAAIFLACVVSTSFGLYLGQGGVVGSSNPRHQITPRTGPGRNFYQRYYPRTRTSGRIINYGVVGGGRYRPAQYVPGPGIVG